MQGEYHLFAKLSLMTNRPLLVWPWFSLVCLAARVWGFISLNQQEILCYLAIKYPSPNEIWYFLHRIIMSHIFLYNLKSESEISKPVKLHHNFFESWVVKNTDALFPIWPSLSYSFTEEWVTISDSRNTKMVETGSKSFSAFSAVKGGSTIQTKESWIQMDASHFTFLYIEKIIKPFIGYGYIFKALIRDICDCLELPEGCRSET